MEINMESKIKIASDALVLIGASPLQSFDDDTVEAMAVNAVYDNTYESMLSEINWSFAKDVLQLKQLTNKPDYGYKYCYRIAGEVIKVINLNNKMNSDYKLRNRREIHTNEQLSTITALVKIPEEELPSDFVLALKFNLAALLAPIVTDNTTASDRFMNMAKVQMGKARVRDAQQQPANYLQQSTLVNMRRG